MRRCFLAVGLASVGFVLQGCGGGGGSTTTTAPPSPAPSPGPPSPPSKCLNEQVDLVTQSLTGSTSGNLDATVSPIPPPLKNPVAFGITGDFTLKFSLETLQVRIDSNIKLTLDGLPGGTVKEKIIFDASKSEDQLVVSVSAHALEKSFENCTIRTINHMPAPDTIKQYLSVAKMALKNATTCTGSDGTYDTWSLSSQGVHPNPNVTAGLDVKMSKDYLWHEIDAHLDKLHLENLKIGGGLKFDTVDGTGKLTSTVTQGSLDPPASSDLDYSGWGTCTKAPPMEFGDVRLKSVLSQLMDTFPKQLLATLFASLDSQQGKDLVV